MEESRQRRSTGGSYRGCQKMGGEGRRRSRGKEGEGGEVGGGGREMSVEGKSAQEIEISRYDRSGRDSSGQTGKVEGE